MSLILNLPVLYHRVRTKFYIYTIKVSIGVDMLIPCTKEDGVKARRNAHSRNVVKLSFVQIGTKSCEGVLNHCDNGLYPVCFEVYIYWLQRSLYQMVHVCIIRKYGSTFYVHVRMGQVQNGHLYLKVWEQQPQPSEPKHLQTKSLCYTIVKMPQEFCYLTQKLRKTSMKILILLSFYYMY